jgi:hypothetical protein
MGKRVGRWIKIDKATWARRWNKVSWRNSEEQMDFGRTEDLCNLDAPEGKILTLENAILHGLAERLQRERASEPNQHRLPIPL